MREDQSGEVNNKENIVHTEAKSVTWVNAGRIFKDTKGKKIITGLTTREAGIRKSFHVQKFTKQWTKNNKQSHLSDHLIIILDLSKLDLIKENKVTLRDFLIISIKKLIHVWSLTLNSSNWMLWMLINLLLTWTTTTPWLLSERQLQWAFYWQTSEEPCFLLDLDKLPAEVAWIMCRQDDRNTM